MRLRSVLVACLAVSSAVVMPNVVAERAAAADLAAIECPAGDASSAEEQTSLEAFEPEGFESYVPQNAERIVDTRNNIGGVSEPLDAGCTLRIDTDTAARWC